MRAQINSVLSASSRPAVPLCVKSKNTALGLEYHIIMGATGNDCQVGLRAIGHEVNLHATSNGLHIDIHGFVLILGSSIIIATHLASDIQCLRLTDLNHTKLVGLSHNRIGHRGKLYFGLFDRLINGVLLEQASMELRNTSLINAGIAGLGSTHSVKGLIRTDVIICAVQRGIPVVQSSIILQYSAFCSICQASLALTIQRHCNVQLCPIDGNSQLIAIASTLDQHIQGRCLIGSSGQKSVIVDTAVDILGLTGINLDHAKLVGLAHNRVGHRGKLCLCSKCHNRQQGQTHGGRKDQCDQFFHTYLSS